MGMRTIAEFVENKDVLHKLEEMGVDYVQGYYVGKPTALSLGNVVVKESRGQSLR